MLSRATFLREAPAAKVARPLSTRALWKSLPAKHPMPITRHRPATPPPSTAPSPGHSELVEESLSASCRPTSGTIPSSVTTRRSASRGAPVCKVAERTGGDARQGAVLVGERFLDTLGMTGEGDERRCFGLSGEARFLDKLGMAGGGRGPAGHPAVSRQKWATRPSPSLTATGRRPTARGDPAGVRNGWIKPGPSPSTMPSW